MPVSVSTPWVPVWLAVVADTVTATVCVLVAVVLSVLALWIRFGVIPSIRSGTSSAKRSSGPLWRGKRAEFSGARHGRGR